MACARIRHSDMPEAVYANFWDHLKSGRPWMGLVNQIHHNAQTSESISEKTRQNNETLVDMAKRLDERDFG